MTLEKLLQLLTNSNLWFSRCDFFEDGWEGHYSPATFSTVERTLRSNDLNTDWEVKNYLKHYKDLNEAIRRTLYISCWHISEVESAALWQIYSRYGKSVAIRTTMERLGASLGQSQEIIHAGRVNYIEYQTDPMSMYSFFTPFLHKRRSFNFEQELRAIYWRRDLIKDGIRAEEIDSPAGVGINVDLASLIPELYLSPQADGPLIEALRLLLDRFHLTETRVIQSNLFAAPR